MFCTICKKTYKCNNKVRVCSCGLCDRCYVYKKLEIFIDVKFNDDIDKEVIKRLIHNIKNCKSTFSNLSEKELIEYINNIIVANTL